MFGNRLRIHLHLSFMSLVLFFVSCVDDQIGGSAQDGYMIITGINPRSYEGDQSGDGIDSKVEMLRVVAFDKATHVCKSNMLYSGTALSGGKIQHYIKEGEYDFVFVTNEGLNASVRTALNGITHYDDLKSISYPAEMFNYDAAIPMVAESNGVKILPGGNVEVNHVSMPELTIHLRRLAARVDVVLKSKIDFGDINDGTFKGVILSNNPDRVPLVYALPSSPQNSSYAYDDPSLPYEGTAVTRNVIREVNPSDNPEQFEQGASLLTPQDLADGLVWAVKIKRIILPSNFFSAKSDDTKAILFTVNLGEKYSPSCKLQILSDPDYTLPANAKLELTGIIKEPLEVNIVPSQWKFDDEQWEIPSNRILNVSHTSVNMTDMNGVRISFWSNMPVVKVLGTVKKDGEANERLTNEVFNCLTVDDNNPDPYRFVYDPVTGSGYMDLLIDGKHTKPSGEAGVHDRTENMTGVYTLVLSAEDENGKHPLQRTIKVTVTQEGLRFANDPTASAHGLFNGVFFKHNQKGERIITGQHAVNVPWSVEVPAAYQDWLVVSATPSFDPGVGTESPGDAEHYPVRLNQYRRETGTKIEGLKGRIYFRVGVKEGANFVQSKDAEPKFGYINLKYSPNGTTTWQYTTRIYVRQGEAAAYIYEKEDTISNYVMNGYNAGTNRTGLVREDLRLTKADKREGAAKFSPYNLTGNALASSANPASEQLDVKGGRFVDFPSQAGAFFQWAVDLKGTASNMTDYYRRAFNSSMPFPASGFPWGYPEFPILWDGDAAKDIPAYKDEFEVCPPGYRRPTDGFTDKEAYNGYYDHLPVTPTPLINHKDEIKDSEIRVSLFNVPFAGNANSSADYLTVFDNIVSSNAGPGTYPWGDGEARKQLKGTYFTFYSDGFFDRRPIKEVASGSYGVSLGNSKAAYQGVLFYNPDTYRSVFFPSAGRLNNLTGVPEGQGVTGYYWSSSVGPAYARPELISNGFNRTIHYGAWSFESAYNSMNLRLSYQGFAQSIRCVRE